MGWKGSVIDWSYPWVLDVGNIFGWVLSSISADSVGHPAHNRCASVPELATSLKVWLTFLFAAFFSPCVSGVRTANQGTLTDRHFRQQFNMFNQPKTVPVKSWWMPTVQETPLMPRPVAVMDTGLADITPVSSGLSKKLTKTDQNSQCWIFKTI